MSAAFLLLLDRPAFTVSTPVTFSPSLDFSDARNSMYL